MKLRFLIAIIVFISSYFPLGLIVVVKDLDSSTFLPQHPIVAAVVLSVVIVACATTILAAKMIKGGLPFVITKMTNRSADMFTYTIPYMISFYNFNLGDWKTLICLGIFMSLMFVLSYRTQNMLVNPVLAIAGYGLYDCQMKDSDHEIQALLISKERFNVGDTCVIERLSHFLYFVSQVTPREKTNV